MRSSRTVLWFGLICLLLCCNTTTGGAQSGGPPYIHIEQKLVSRESPSGTAIYKVWFVATKEKLEPGTIPANDQLWTGDIREYCHQLLFDGRPIDMVGESMAAADTSDIAFLLAVDVSGSMAGDAYDQRLGAVCAALRAFAERNRGNSRVWIRLIPFGHDVPYDVLTRVTQPGGGDWWDEYIGLTDDGTARLLAALKDIESFGKSASINNVDTALYAAFVLGVQELMDLPPRFDGIVPKPVLVVLTDGRNDLHNYPDNSNASVSLEDVVGVLKPQGQGRAQLVPRVYTIGFALGGQDHKKMSEIESISPRVHFREVRDLQDASEQLTKIYEDILSIETKSRWFEFDTGWTEVNLAKYGLPPFNRVGGPGAPGFQRPPLEVMVLAPSPIVSRPEQRDRMRIFAIAAAVILGAGLLLFFTGSRVPRDTEGAEEVTDEQRGKALGEDEKPKPIRTNIMSVQEWERRKQQTPASVSDETRMFEDDTE